MPFDELLVFVHDGVYSCRSGAGTSNRRFVECLVRLGYGPALTVCPVLTAPDNPDYDDEWVAALAGRLAAVGARLEPVDNGSGGRDRYGSVANWRESARAAAAAVADRVGRGRSPLVLSFDTPFIALIPTLAVSNGVFHVHVPRSTARLHAPHDAERLSFERQALTGAGANTLVGAISDHMGEHLAREYDVPRGRIVAVPSGILLDEATPARAADVEAALASVSMRSDEPFLLAYGRAGPYKGFHTLLEALARLGREAPALALVAARVDERDEYVASLEREIGDHALRVALVTTFERELPRLLQQAPSLVAVVVPSLREPFGLVPVEVHANPYCFAPVVAARAGGLVEQVEDGETGFTFAPGDAAGLAAAVRAALALDERGRRALKRRAEARLARFDLLQAVRVLMERVARTQPARPLTPSTV